ncbi:hypothetical protein LMG24235_08559 [Paraburkholderia sabiae]|nr:hypothetical protein LMG24235_08559 [Paraburkholderia sabiae]
MTNSMGQTKKTPRATLPPGIGKVLKRLHYPLDVIVLLSNAISCMDAPGLPSFHDAMYRRS